MGKATLAAHRGSCRLVPRIARPCSTLLVSYYDLFYIARSSTSLKAKGISEDHACIPCCYTTLLDPSLRLPHPHHQHQPRRDSPRYCSSKCDSDVPSNVMIREVEKRQAARTERVINDESQRMRHTSLSLTPRRPSGLCIYQT